VKIRGKAGQAERRSAARIGRRRMRFPVAAKMALASAGAAARNAGLAAPAGRFGAGHDMDFDFARRVAHAQDLVVVKIALLHSSAGNSDLALQGLRQAKMMAPSIWAFTLSGLMAVPQSMAQTMRSMRRAPFLRVASDFRDLGDIASPAKRGGDTAPTFLHGKER